MNFAKKDVVEASGSLQLCAGRKSGSEAAIHAMNSLFEADDIDAVLLIDASNAFNAQNCSKQNWSKDEKCWIIVKPEKEESVREAFRRTAIKVTVHGQKHLGAAQGSREYLEEYVNEKVSNWVNEVTKLAEFAISQPQASYAAYTFGLKHRWTYFLRTLPDIQDLLEPLEKAISQIPIPAITDHQCNPLDRDILALWYGHGKSKS